LKSVMDIGLKHLLDAFMNDVNRESLRIR